MDLLKRELAPVPSEAWEQIDEEARRVLKLHLAGRKVVDFSGPHGWKYGAVNTGRLTHSKTSEVKDVSYATREVRRLVELRTPFTMAIADLDDAARGAGDIETAAVIAAAERIARAEDSAIFHGHREAGIRGIIEASPHAPIDVKSAVAWPEAVTHAKEVLRLSGVDGPYALALGAQAYDDISAQAEDGYPIRKRIAEGLIEGPIVWAPAIQGGAVLLSTRGGDYELTVGQDMSIGYFSHDREKVELFLTESFTFRVLEERPAVFLRRKYGQG